VILTVLVIFTSIVLFYFGASWLIKGSTSLALKANISPLVTGLTIVAFGTSSPGLIVSLNATISGQGNIALGNVIGSNIFNICIILGISAIVAPLKIKIQLLKIDVSILILATIGFIILFTDRNISQIEGSLMLTGIVLYWVLNFILAHRENDKKEVTEEYNEAIKANAIKWYWSAGWIISGIGLLIAGSELLLKSAVEIALSLGVGETIISLSLVAAVTNLPGLIFSIAATVKKEHNIAVRNLIGSTIYNTLGIIGISGVIHPLSAIAISNIDLYLMLGVTLLLLPFFRTKFTLKRDDGIFMVVLYLVYLYYLWPK
jgi:cation:H+ antiporter